MASNPLGDVEITDPQAMRALAHPVRLAILDQLQREGPSTASELSPSVGATPSVTSWHLRHLARFGLVQDSEPGPDRRQRRWQAVGRGYRFESPEDADDVEGRSAARLLSRQLFRRSESIPSRWSDDVEPRLESVWRRLAGVADTRVVLSASELAELEDSIEQLLAPYVMRQVSERPAGSRGVRLLRYTLPERAADENVPTVPPGAGSPGPTR